MKISVRLPGHLAILLDAKVSEESSSRSAVIVEALEEFLSDTPLPPAEPLPGEQALFDVSGDRPAAEDKSALLGELRQRIDAVPPLRLDHLNEGTCPGCGSDRRDQWLGAPCTDPWHPGRTTGYRPVSDGFDPA